MQHPNKSQLSKIFHRYFYAFDADSEIRYVVEQCSHCTSLASFPQEIEKLSTSPPLPTPGAEFACDIMRCARQHNVIFLLRDCFSSFTATQIITNEQSDSLRSALITTTAELKVGTGCIVRVDGAKAFQSLLNEHGLKKHGIQLQPGRVKNRNKNAVAEKAIQELEIKIKKQHPEGGPQTSDDLATATSTLNASIRDRGLRARDILHQ